MAIYLAHGGTNGFDRRGDKAKDPAVCRASKPSRGRKLSGRISGLRRKNIQTPRTSLPRPHVTSILLGRRRGAAADPTERDVQSEMVRALYNQAPPILVLTLLGAVCVAIGLWTRMPTSELLIWTGATVTISLGRLLLGFQFFKAKPKGVATRAWALSFAIGCAAAGLLWGVAGIIFYDPTKAWTLVLMVFLVSALTTSAVGGYSSHMPSFYAFLVPLVVLFAGRLIWTMERLELVLGMLFVIWAGAVVAMGRNINRALHDRITLQLENERLVAQMMSARDEAERASHAKGRFLANMSHELRTPLNAIIGFSEAMERQTFGPMGDTRYVEYARTVKDGGKHLLDLISNILDMSKSESGLSRLDETRFDPGDMISRSLSIAVDRAREGGVTLLNQTSLDLPLIQGDVTKFRQIVLNLVTNAIKFTPKGGSVMVGARIAPTGEFLFEVRDTGIGMEAEDIPRALTPFVQLEDSSRSCAKDTRFGSEGTGLGLPLVKGLVELHGGEIDIKSTPGHGTTVTVSLPARRVITGRKVDPHEPLVKVPETSGAQPVEPRLV